MYYENYTVNILLVILFISFSFSRDSPDDTKIFFLIFFIWYIESKFHLPKMSTSEVIGVQPLVD